MEIDYSLMRPDDYSQAYALWQRCEGIGLSSADSECAITTFLLRNPGMSFTARLDGGLVGTALCGTDGRRGFLYHLAVDPTHRREGIGMELASRCLRALKAEGIGKCHIMVFKENQDGRKFWEKTGWKLRSDLVLMSAELTSEKEGCSC